MHEFPQYDSSTPATVHINRNEGRFTIIKTRANDSDDSDDDNFNGQTSNFNRQREVDSKTITSSNSKFRTLADLQANSENDHQHAHHTISVNISGGDGDNEGLDMQRILKRFREVGSQRLEQELLEQGIARQEISKLLTVLQMIELQQQLHRQNISPNPRHGIRKKVKIERDEDSDEDSNIVIISQKNNDNHNNSNTTSTSNFSGPGHILNPSRPEVNRFEPPSRQPISPFFTANTNIHEINNNNINNSKNNTTTTSIPEKPTTKFSVDPNKPKTSIQIRLHNGEKLIAEFNYTHTVSDIYTYLTSIPSSPASFQLMIYPRKILSNHSETIEKAGLINATIVQTAK